MKEFKGTKGEWIVAHDEFDGHSVGVKDKDFGTLFIAQGIEQGHDDGLADAKLIAAAPDLLENLLRLVEWIKEDGTQDNYPSAFIRAEAAIEKALN
jgi:hypothetical protein